LYNIDRAQPRDVACRRFLINEQTASIEIPKYQYFGSYLRIFGEMW
jgi:hypothetical protein